MSKKNFYDTDTIQKAYTAKKLADLINLIVQQVTPVYGQMGMVFPVICSSTLLCLSTRGPASVTEIARLLHHPHQTVAQHLRILTGLGIIEKQPDPNDKRRSEYHLTDLGLKQAALLGTYNLRAADVFQSLSDDINVDLPAVLDAGVKALTKRTMEDRFWELFDMEETK